MVVNELSMEKHAFIKKFLNSSSFNLLQLAGDASSRRYYRLIQNNSSYVIMDWDPFDKKQSHPFLSTQELFKINNINVPEVYTYDSTLGVFILEDLGDLTLERKFWESQNQTLSLPFYKRTIDELIKIHNIETKQEKAWTPLNIKFTSEKLLWELNYTKEHLLEKFLGLKINEKIIKEFSWLANTLSELPDVVCHRDYHSRNVMLKLNEIRIIDFQDARLGPRQYDLVSLLYDSYVDIKPELIKELTDYYIKNSQIINPVVLDTFSQMMNLQLIQRCFKACGSFASFFNSRGDTRYLKYISPTIKRVILTLEKIPELNNLRTFLLTNQLQEKDYIKHGNARTNGR